MPWINTARAIVAGGAFRFVDRDSGAPVDKQREAQAWSALEGKGSDPSRTVVLDLFTASMLVQVADALSEGNRAKFCAMPLLPAVELGWRLVAPAQNRAGGA
jgi:hypothetical protein